MSACRVGEPLQCIGQSRYSGVLLSFHRSGDVLTDGIQSDRFVHKHECLRPDLSRSSVYA